MSTIGRNIKTANPQTETFMDGLLYPMNERLGVPRTPWLLISIAAFLGVALFSAYRVYQHRYSFTMGLDYFEPVFQTYWMNLMYAQLIILTLIAAVGVPWLWITRTSTEEIAKMTPMRELSFYHIILGAMTVGSVFIIIILGVYVESDAAWHQITIRDTDFTPTHIGLFYFGIPLAGVAIALGFTWVHTRMPDFHNRISVPLALALSTPVLIMPNLGLNEWGHTFFYAEELFAAPIHWGFVVLGWGLFGLAGFLLQCIQRIRILTSIPTDTNK